MRYYLKAEAQAAINLMRFDTPHHKAKLDAIEAHNLQVATIAYCSAQLNRQVWQANGPQLTIISPSTREPGAVQVTHFVSCGPRLVPGYHDRARTPQDLAALLSKGRYITIR